jgi:hypothetical protein
LCEEKASARQAIYGACWRWPDRHGLALGILCPIPGIGRVTAVAILVECPEIGTMAASKKASPAGLAPPPGRLLRNRRPGNG